MPLGRNKFRPRFGGTVHLLVAWTLVAMATVARAQQPPGPPAPPSVAPRAMGETLEEAFRCALTSDQRIEASQRSVASAESSWSSARAQRLPSVTLGADAYALSESPTMLVGVPGLGTISQPFLDRTSGGCDAIVAQPLYTSGRITSGIAAAQANVTANQSDLCRTVLDVKMNVAESFVAVLRAARLLEVAQARVTSLASHRRDVWSMFEKGAVSKNDYLAAEVALADAQQQALDAANRLDIARAAYNRAVGRDLAAPVELAPLQDDGVPVDFRNMVNVAMQRRPELATLSAQAAAYQDQAVGERAKAGPQVQVQGGYLYQRETNIEHDGIAAVLVTANWNALDMGRSRHAANALAEKAESVLRLRRDAQSLIALEVRQRSLELETARQRVQVARQATAQADENLRVVRDRYQHQVGTNTEVLDAETLRVQAYTNLWDSSYQAVLASLRLRRAAGTL
jgi:outer membrane protein